MTKQTIAKAIAVFIFATGLLVALGWKYNIVTFQSLSNNLPSMKFSTAVCFMLAGILLYLISVPKKSKWISIILSACCQWILLLVIMCLIGQLTGVSLGLEHLYVSENRIKEVSAGASSLGSLIALALVGITGLIYIFNSERKYKRLKITGITIAGFGCTALIGYLMNWPILYFYQDQVSSGMAVHTALLLVAYGIGLRFAVKSLPTEKYLK